MKKAWGRQEKPGEEVEHYGRRRYRADSWSRSRRIVLRAEPIDGGDTPRLLVTTLPDEPKARCCFYAKRGPPENWINDRKNTLFVDRLSCHPSGRGHSRLLRHTAACVLLVRFC